MNRIFDKTPDGLLIETSEDARKGRRFSTVNTAIDILWTAEEEAARDAEEKAAEEARAADVEIARQKAAARDVALSKLQQLGISQEDLAALMG